MSWFAPVRAHTESALLSDAWGVSAVLLWAPDTELCVYQELISAIKVPSARTLWLRLWCCPSEQSWDELCSSVAWTADRGRCVGLLGDWRLCWDS